MVRLLSMLDSLSEKGLTCPCRAWAGGSKVQKWDERSYSWSANYGIQIMVRDVCHLLIDLIISRKD